MKKQTKLYAAYGSNMNLVQMEARCPTANHGGISTIPGYALSFRYYATIEPHESKKVPVVLWHIDEAAEAALDRYEGYPRHYRKETVKLEDGRTAMAYIMNEDIRPYSDPSSAYLSTILTGYAENKIKTVELLKAINDKADSTQQEE